MSGQCGTNITSSDSVHSDTQSAIVTHSHASRDIFFPQQCSSRCTHIHANLCTDAFRQRTKSKCRHKHRHPTEQTDTCTVTHADTHKGVTLISHCACLLALFHPSHHDSQSLRITATSASTEKSMVKHINKNTIKPIEWKATSGPLK